MAVLAASKRLTASTPQCPERVTASPGKGGLGTYAPRLDTAGNSIEGQLAARYLARSLGLDLNGLEAGCAVD
ncbi:MAG: glutaminase [Kribbellaceae bacterium]